MKKIIVPVSVEAMSRLDFDENIEGDLIELALNKRSFDELWGLGIFERLNSSLDICIDDYEDESITESDNLNVAREIIAHAAEEMIENGDLAQLLLMTDKAIACKTGLFFFF